MKFVICINKRHFPSIRVHRNTLHIGQNSRHCLDRVPDVRSWWNFHRSFWKILWSIWHHIPVHQEFPCPPRLHLSSKSITGVFEDMEILDELVYGIMWVKVSFRIFCESFIKIWHQEPCLDYVFISVYFGAHKRTDGKCLLFILIIGFLFCYKELGE